MHFLNTLDYSRAELDQLIESAKGFKNGDNQSKPLAGKSIALVFVNPSLRTRAVTQVGIYVLGGNAVGLEPELSSGDRRLDRREMRAVGGARDHDDAVARHALEYVRDQVALRVHHDHRTAGRHVSRGKVQQHELRPRVGGPARDDLFCKGGMDEDREEHRGQ